jgi:CheY-like chemotaxis protein
MAQILIVDNEAMVRRALREALAPRGHEVLEAGTGVAAITRLRHTPVDIVMLDLFMPEMDGVEASFVIRQLHPQVKLVFMTGAAAGETPGGRPLPPGIPLLRKPFRTPEVYEIIDRLLAS